MGLIRSSLYAGCLPVKNIRKHPRSIASAYEGQVFQGQIPFGIDKSVFWVLGDDETARDDEGFNVRCIVEGTMNSPMLDTIMVESEDAV